MYVITLIASIEMVRLTSQSRDIPEVAILGGKRISMDIVAVFSTATIVEFRAATYVFSLYTRYTNQSGTRNASFEQQTTGSVDLQPRQKGLEAVAAFACLL